VSNSVALISKSWFYKITQHHAKAQCRRLEFNLHHDFCLTVFAYIGFTGREIAKMCCMAVVRKNQELTDRGKVNVKIHTLVSPLYKSGPVYVSI